MKAVVMEKFGELPTVQTVPDPVPVAVIQRGRLAWPAPDAPAQLAATPDWAKPVLEAALQL